MIRFVACAAAGLVIAGCAPLESPVPEEPARSLPAPAPAPEEQLVKPAAPAVSGPERRIKSAIDNVRRRNLLTSNGFWTVFHGILGLGPKATTLRDPRSGNQVNAFDYIRNGGELRGLRFIPTRHGLDVQMGPWSVGQGHQDQFVAEMGQWGTAIDTPFVVNGKNYTFRDFVRHSQMAARTTDKQELSWAIVIVGQYLGTDISWTNGRGEKLEYTDLIRYELDADVEHAACGGTHRLFGLTWAYHLHKQRGLSTTGIWEEIPVKEAKYRELARRYQNADGSFSTEFFRGRGNDQDKQLRINTTGHVLEWLALAAPDEELRAPWVQSAASALSLMILDLQSDPIEGGSLYHAVHGLILYHARVYGTAALGACKPYFPYPLKGDKGR
jgi:hypothetical protein